MQRREQVVDQSHSQRPANTHTHRVLSALHNCIDLPIQNKHMNKQQNLLTPPHCCTLPPETRKHSSHQHALQSSPRPHVKVW